MKTTINEVTLVTDQKVKALKQELFAELKEIIKNPVVVAAYSDAIANVQPILSSGEKNPWVGKDINYFVTYFEEWFTWLPQPVGGLGKIVPFTYFYLNNKIAYYFLNEFKSSIDGTTYSTEIFNWTVKFIKERGEFMDSPESLVYIQDWIEDPNMKIEDFIIPEGGFKSFNDFFTRQLNLNKTPEPRPIFEKEDDSVLTASADSEINFIQSDLTLTTKLNVKSRQINVNDLLDGSEYASKFVGGTAVSCVLMPTSYHRYHSPVNGKIVESKEIPGVYNGITDGEDWFNSGNIGESTTEFSIFEDFHRAYYIIKTKAYGYVAMIPVGLNTISSLNFNTLVTKESTLVPKGGIPVPVLKGDQVGHFAYGGSLNILLFESNVFSAMSVLMGQRLGTLNNPNLNCIEFDQPVFAEWTNDCMESKEQPEHYAQYYTFFIHSQTNVQLDLQSEAVDTFLILKKGFGVDGPVINKNDDFKNNPKHSQITALLEPGYYTVEATTYNKKETGKFILGLENSISNNN